MSIDRPNHLSKRWPKILYSSTLAHSNIGRHFCMFLLKKCKIISNFPRKKDNKLHSNYQISVLVCSRFFRNKSVPYLRNNILVKSFGKPKLSTFKFTLQPHLPFLHSRPFTQSKSLWHVPPSLIRHVFVIGCCLTSQASPLVQSVFTSQVLPNLCVLISSSNENARIVPKRC